ncbi:MAG TPA: hypothetical protein VGO50_20460 [Pyrinomonadaceae bacterium]|nr:hypothetical protein [Pyrinomonadaceae bacterium]
MDIEFTTDRTFGIFLMTVYTSLIALLAVITLNSGSDRYVPGGIAMALCFFPVTIWPMALMASIFGPQTWHLIDGIMIVSGFFLNNCLLYFCGSRLARLFMTKARVEFSPESADKKNPLLKTYLLGLLAAAIGSIPVIILGQISENPLWRHAADSVLLFDGCLVITVPAVMLGINYLRRAAKLARTSFLRSLNQ